MKKIKGVIFLLILFISCRENKELLVNKWRITGVSHNNEAVADSLVELLHAEMEFTKDGTFSLTGAAPFIVNQTGTYTLSKDGKRVTILSNGTPGTREIIELSSSKLIMKDSEKNIKWSAIPAANY